MRKPSFLMAAAAAFAMLTLPALADELNQRPRRDRQG